MGTIRQDAAVVVVYDDALISSVEAIRAAMPPEVRHLLLGPVYGFNGARAFLWSPDGSKEGWEQSNLADEWRTQLIAWAKAQAHHVDWVTVRFGGDWPESVEAEGGPA